MREITKANLGAQPWSLRGHHAACIQGFRGEGYSSAFVANMGRFVELLIKNPETRVYISRHGAGRKNPSADKICSACPSMLKTGHCEVEGDISHLDDAWEETLGLEPGRIYTWKEVVERVRERASVSDIASNCAGCGWKSLGYCEEGLRKLGCPE